MSMQCHWRKVWGFFQVSPITMINYRIMYPIMFLAMKIKLYSTNIYPILIPHLNIASIQEGRC